MKIGIVSPYLDTMSGGERYMLTAAEYWSREHNVDIFWDSSSIKKKAREKLSIDLTRTHIVPNVFKRAENVLKKIEKTRQYDLLFILSDGSIPLSFAKKNILHFQRPFPAVQGASFTNQLKLKRYNMVVCNSAFTKRWIDKTYKVRSKVLYPPVPVDEFSSGKKERTILSVGRFHPFKKQDIMISVFKALHEVMPKWKLVLVGGLLDQDKGYFEALKALADGLPVEIKPNSSFDELVQLYKTSRLYWHAAGIAENERIYPEAMEHFGITTVEAMAAGCVPLVYKGGGQPEIVNHGEHGMLWETEEELLKQTIGLVKKPHKIRTIKKHAIARAESFSVQHFQNELDSLIQTL